jgi:hypothetical protein
VTALLAAPAGPVASPVILAAVQDDRMNGTMGLVVFLFLAAAVVLLLVSFRHHLRRVPATFDNPESVINQAAVDAAATAGQRPPADPRPTENA